MQANKFESTSGLTVILEKVDRLKSELDALRPLNSDQEARVMQKFRLDWNYHSNSIEGNSLTYGETIAFLMEGLTAKGKPFKDHLDIKGHNEAINYLMEMVKNRHQLNEKVIRELHEIILVEPYKTPAKTADGQMVEKQVTLGAYKKMPNHVKTPTGEIHYYATPEETPAKMADLMDWLRDHQEKEDLHPLIIAAVFHYQFVAIHPFDDGNGRMSRLLMNLLLMQYHYPPIVIRQEERNLYYNALRQADAGDLAAFVEFIGENMVHALEVYLRGARGESIEEEDDLDKEIALLKVSFKGKHEAVPKSESIIIELLTKTFLPLFYDIEEKCIKLNELFFKTAGVIHTEEKVTTMESPYFATSTKDWRQVEERVRQYRLQKKGYRLTKFNYEYNWIDFSTSKRPFSVRCTLEVHFQNYSYLIKFQGSYEKLNITKSYDEYLSKEEAKQITNIFIKEALTEVKVKTRIKD